MVFLDRPSLFKDGFNTGFVVKAISTLLPEERQFRNGRNAMTFSHYRLWCF